MARDVQMEVDPESLRIPRAKRSLRSSDSDWLAMVPARRSPNESSSVAERVLRGLMIDSGVTRGREPHETWDACDDA